MSEHDNTRGRVNPRATAARGTLLGAMFLMATSAVGPGFITQTTEFTAQLGAVFSFAILVSILVDIAVQLNIWRVVGVAGERAQDLANRVVPGAGYLLAGLTVFGGLVFNIGNIGGTALGLDALVGLDVQIGGAVSAVLAIAIFLTRRAGVAIDRIIVVLGVAMIVLTCYVAVVSNPPVGTAMRQAVLPESLGADVFFATVTIIGGTVGGYITYAGAHRMIDSGTKGPENVATITRASVSGILITGIMRILLFLAVLGVVTGGAVVLDSTNPPAAAFQSAAGDLGMRLFGVIMWAAAVSSVIGASYTSISFLTTFSGWMHRHRGWLVAAFIAVSAIGYLLLQEPPATLLIFAGALNGLILPVGLGIMLWVGAFRGHDLLGGYRYPRWLLCVGVLAWLVTIVISYQALSEISALWQ